MTAAAASGSNWSLFFSLSYRSDTRHIPPSSDRNKGTCLETCKTTQNNSNSSSEVNREKDIRRRWMGQTDSQRDARTRGENRKSSSSFSSSGQRLRQWVTSSASVEMHDTCLPVCVALFTRFPLLLLLLHLTSSSRPFLPQTKDYDSKRLPR